MVEVYSRLPRWSVDVRQAILEVHTNKWSAIAISKLIAHELLSIYTAILVTRARRRQDWLVDLEID